MVLSLDRRNAFFSVRILWQAKVNIRGLITSYNRVWPVQPTCQSDYKPWNWPSIGTYTIHNSPVILHMRRFFFSVFFTEWASRAEGKGNWEESLSLLVIRTISPRIFRWENSGREILNDIKNIYLNVLGKRSLNLEAPSVRVRHVTP